MSFVAAMTVVGGVLGLSDREAPQGFLATNLHTLNGSASHAADPVFQIAVPLERARWQSIVIHDLGAPAGDPESIHRRHLGYGYTGLGHHFLIGNGNGLGDGVLHVGYRWNEQLPGAHALGLDADWHNQHSISVCLIGNGDRRPFTDRQITHLISLVQRLQRELDIPASEVYLHRDIAAGVPQQVSSPGRYFPLARVQDQLLP